MTKEEFGKFIKTLAMLIPRFAPRFDDQDILNAWYQTFKGFNRDKLIQAFGVCKRSFDDFPSIRQIIEIYRACGGKEPRPQTKQLKSDGEMAKILLQLGISSEALDAKR